jgi:hypothetical protein
LYQIRAVVELGRLNIDDMIARHGHLMDKATYAGRFYSDKSFGLSFLAIPVYALYRFMFGPCGNNEWMKYLLSLICVALPHLISVFMMYYLYIYKRGGRSVRMTALIGYVFGTIAYTYGTLLYSHTLGTALLLISYMLIEKWKDSYTWSGTALIGFLLGTAMIAEYPLAIICGWLGVLFVIRLIRCGRLPLLVACIVAGAIPLTVQMYVQYVSFGHILLTGYAYKASLTQKMYHSTGFFGVYYPSLESIFGILFSPSRGMFYFSPFLLFGFLSIYKMIRVQYTRLQGIICACIVVSFTLFAVSVVDWKAGWTVGPRYYLAVVPFLVIPILQTGLPYRATAMAGSFLEKILFPALVLWSVIHCVVITSAFHLIPENFHVPLWDFSIPLIKRGYGSFNIGELIGLPGSASRFVLYAIVALLFMWAYALRPRFIMTSGYAKSIALVFALTGIAVLSTRLIANPDTIDKHFEFSSIFLYWNKPVDRLRELYIIHNRQPNRVDYEYLLAQHLKNLGFHAESLRHIESIIEKVPKHQQALKDTIILTSSIEQTMPEYKKLKSIPPDELLRDYKRVFYAIRIFKIQGDYGASSALIAGALSFNSHTRSLMQIKDCIRLIRASSGNTSTTVKH